VSSIIGLVVKLDREIDRAQPCHANFVTINPDRILTCQRCGRKRGNLSPSTADWIETLVNKFGCPTSPLVVRNSSDSATS
jgi:hypothetical protein